ncbi:hypothetical protein [Fulvivirga lutea]|uniref:Uncharacterized protein n=1 Tax=Fulvivirga lutea TaxID=2810512 RepID=A0A975A2A4_9BACT|nr:hypothetical protein [Fulvivirga lutea]QSE99279.1 hypothetical protein JR347_09385 [Fulvivirga lutea]
MKGQMYEVTMNVELDELLDFGIVGEKAYKSKIEYILATNKGELSRMKNTQDKIDYFINHFVMTDYDTKQLKAYLNRYGEEGFLQLIEEIIMNKG